MFGDGWRWALWVPAVVAAGCFAMLFFLLPLKPVRGNGREKLWKIDWFGIGASVTGIVLLLVSPVVFSESRSGLLCLVNLADGWGASARLSGWIDLCTR